MSTENRSCDDWRQALDDFVDGELTPEDHRQAQEHLDGCESCRRELEDIERLLAATRDLPRSVEAPAGLWAAIEPRLARRGWLYLTASTAEGWAGRWTALLQAAAAVFLIVLGGVVSQLVWPGGTAGGIGREPTIASGDLSRGDDRADGRGFELASAEAEYLRAKESLWLMVYEHREELSPATRSVVERNLRIIDEAIRELRQALAEDPGNRQLEGLLFANHRRSIDLLRRLARATNEI